MHTVDAAQWPLLIVSVAGRSTDDQFDEYLSVYDGWLQRREVYAAVYVTHPSTPMISSDQAKRQAEWMKERDAMLRECCVGVAFVLPSLLMRGVLKAILWMQPMPCPHIVTSVVDEGVEWASQRLGQRGVVLPPLRRTS